MPDDASLCIKRSIPLPGPSYAAFPGVKPPAGSLNPYNNPSSKNKSPVPKYLPTDPAASDSYYISSADNTAVYSAAMPAPTAQPSTSSSSSSSPTASNTPSSSPGTVYAYTDGLQGGWFDASWYTQAYLSSAGQGLDGSSAACANIDTNGALAMRSRDFGAFSGKRVLQLYARTDQGVPDVHINLSGSKVGGPGSLPAAACIARSNRAGLDDPSCMLTACARCPVSS
jgi:hypothetical protein